MNSDSKDNIDCLFCHVPSEKVVIEENGYVGKQCENCNLIFISPRPSPKDVVDLYAHDGAHVSAESHINSGFLKRLYAKNQLKIIGAHKQNGAILDIGAGAGNFLTEARTAGFSPHAIEFNPTQAEHIRTTLDIPCEETAVAKGIFDGKLFDIVFHCDVISHMYDPIADFKAMNQVMNDGGLLVFETGNLGDVDRKHYRRFDVFQYPDHIFFFSTKNLEDLLNQTGFDLIEINRYEIANQLRIENLAGRLKRWIKNKAGNSQTSRNANEPQSETPKQNGTPLMNLYKLGLYSATYKLGKIKPSFNRPQTLIVVAQKRDHL